MVPYRIDTAKIVHATIKCLIKQATRTLRGTSTRNESALNCYTRRNNMPTVVTLELFHSHTLDSC